MAAMKTLFFAFAVLFLIYQVHSANLIIGNPINSVLLYRTTENASAIIGGIVQKDVIYRGFAVNLTYISAIEVGVSQNASAFLIGGGLGSANATIRLQSYVSRGFYYSIEFWGR